MDEDRRCKPRYVNCGKLKGLSVRKTGSPGFVELHPGVVQLGPTFCYFEREGMQEFQVKDTLELLFALEDGSCTAQATVVSVQDWMCLDEGYHQERWYNYGVEFNCGLAESVYQCLVGGPKKTGTLRRGQDANRPHGV
jgi:hypothetical protein